MTRSNANEDLPARLWTLQETADFLAIPLTTLYKLNHKRSGPRFFRVGRHCRYDPRDVYAWLQTRGVAPEVA
jgi:predicted DNA-binding transcriptional regulator AlpA